MRRVAAAGLLIFSLAFGSLWLWRLRYSPEVAMVGDSTWYFTTAEDLVTARNSPLLTNPERGSFLDPGYPHLLALWFRVAGVSLVAGQALNGIFWGLTCLFTFLASRYWLDERRAMVFGCLVAIAPSLSSFGPKLYSELAAIAGGALALWSWYALRAASSRLARVTAGTAFALGMAVLVLTKSAFFPLLVILVVVSWVRRMPALAVPLTLLLLFVWPIHHEVQRAGRGRIGVAGQITRVQIWPTSVALRCGVYSLSWNLGLTVFPEVEGACEPFLPRPGQPMAELNANPWLKPELRKSFTYTDALRTIARRPFKYALVCGVSLLGGVWIEGVFPAAIADLGATVRTALWILKVLLSSALWLASLSVIAASLRQPKLRAVAFPPAVAIAYILLFQMNLLGEQRYFFPLLPALYLLASQWFWWRAEVKRRVPSDANS